MGGFELTVRSVNPPRWVPLLRVGSGRTFLPPREITVIDGDEVSAEVPRGYIILHDDYWMQVCDCVVLGGINVELNRLSDACAGSQ